MKTNFTFEIEHPETALPQQVKHPKKITAEEIAAKMDCRRKCLTLKVLNYKEAK